MKVMVGYHIMNEVEIPNGEAQVKHALSIVRSISNESERSLVLGELLNDIILDADPALADFLDTWDGEITSVYNSDFESNGLDETLWEG